MNAYLEIHKMRSFSCIPTVNRQNLRKNKKHWFLIRKNKKLLNS